MNASSLPKTFPVSLSELEIRAYLCLRNRCGFDGEPSEQNLEHEIGAIFGILLGRPDIILSAMDEVAKYAHSEGIDTAEEIRRFVQDRIAARPEYHFE